MGKTENKNLSEFIRAINLDADIECEKIKKDALDEKREKLSAAGNEFENDCLEKISKAHKNIQSESNREITAFENKMRDELIEKRNRIENDVFSKVESKLKQFVKTPEYKNFLLKSAAEIGNVIKGENLVVFMRNEDILFSDEIQTAIAKPCSIESDNSIVIGGLKASTDIQSADDTLGHRLNKEREWFVNNSGLTIV